MGILCLDRLYCSSRNTVETTISANIYAHLDTARKSSIADSLADRIGAA